MRNIFIIHGSNGIPDEQWYPWLRSELQKDKNNNVIVPQFQIPDKEVAGGHHYSQWRTKLLEYKDKINKDTIFIGHSRGCQFIMLALTDIGIKNVGGIFLVAPWVQYRWYDSPKNLVDSFHYKVVDWSALKKVVSHIEIFQSTNDVIPLEEGVGIAAMLAARLEIVPNAGHFVIKSGYSTFPLLLAKITKYIDVTRKIK